MIELNERLLVVEQLLTCTRCELHHHCSAPVPFSGPTPARIAMVGEAPGRNEDEAGAPFVGRAGQLIRQLLGAVGFDPEEIFIANTASCWPGEEIKTPGAEHVAACRINKLAQLDLADPQYVLLLGGVALAGFRPEMQITKAKGLPFQPEGVDYVCFPTIHPSYAMRRGRVGELELRRDLERFRELTEAASWHDFIPETCWVCKGEGWWMDAEGIVTCQAHMPEAGKARKALLEADYREVKARVGARR